MKVLVVGSAALDTVRTPFGVAGDAIGGSAIYFAAAASFFAAVKVVAVVGEDFPLYQLDFLKKRKVDLSGLEIAPGKTFRWSGVYHDDMNQRDTLLTELNVFETFAPKLPPAYRDTPIVFLANIHPELQLDVLRQMAQPELVMLDTMNLWISTALPSLKKVMKRTHGIILNDQEARQLTGESNLIKAARGVAQMGPRLVIIKKGEHGAILLQGDDFFALPAYPLEVLHDPTGAGDSFAGGLIGYLACGRKPSLDMLRRAMAYGTIVASFAVEEFSIERLRTLTPSQMELRFLHFKKMLKF